MGARGNEEDIGSGREQAGDGGGQEAKDGEQQAERAGNDTPASGSGQEQEPAPATDGNARLKCDAAAQRVNKDELLGHIVVAVERRLTSGDLKPTIGDMIRLWQFEKDLGIDQPKEVKVQWVDPPTPDTASEE